MLEVLNNPIESLDLGSWINYYLHSANISSIKDLVQYNETELLQLLRFQNKCLKDIKGKLEALNLSLGMTVNPDENSTVETTQQNESIAQILQQNKPQNVQQDESIAQASDENNSTAQQNNFVAQDNAPMIENAQQDESTAQTLEQNDSIEQILEQNDSKEEVDDTVLKKNLYLEQAQLQVEIEFLSNSKLSLGRTFDDHVKTLQLQHIAGTNALRNEQYSIAKEYFEQAKDALIWIKDNTALGQTIANKLHSLPEYKNMMISEQDSNLLDEEIKQAQELYEQGEFQQSQELLNKIQDTIFSYRTKEFIKRSQDSLKNHHCYDAEQWIEKAISIQKNNKEALKLQSAINSNLAEIKTLLVNAKQEIDRKNLNSAVECLQNILSLEDHHEESIQLLEQTKQTMNKVTALLEEANKAIAEKQWHIVEKIIQDIFSKQIDNPDTIKMQNEAKETIDTITRLSLETQYAFRNKQWKKALNFVNNILVLQPDREQTIKLKETIEENIIKQKKHRKSIAKGIVIMLFIAGISVLILKLLVILNIIGV